ncbi:MAG: hypothetical protein CMJ78_08745 [Planctomycetaceae bacterium]|nr:hypothetical protein [Planctomycetaceae bacterium]
MNRIASLLLITLLALWAIVIFAAVSPSKSYPGASTHPQEREMDVAGESIAFDAEMIATGTVTGLLLIAVYLLCLSLGAGKNGYNRRFVGLVILSACGVCGSFLAMAANYGGYVTAQQPEIVAGFPVPTAWMVYGVWLCPLVFLAIYVIGFKSWVMTDEDQQRLARLVADRQSHS